MKRCEINIRDPFILPFEGKYYMYGSRTKNQFGFEVYVSNDLENFSEPKTIFEKCESFWGEFDFWAPEVHCYNGKFYLFATFKAQNSCRRCHILVCDTPDGTFVPLTDTPCTPEDWESLDGTLHIDKKGIPHLVFCHEWVQIGDGTICEVTLSKDLKEVLTKPRVLWYASQYKDVKSMSGGGKHYVTDGPYFYRNGEELLCVWSSFNKNGYAELISKSDNGDIDGNWTVLDTPLSSTQGGHGMIFKDFTGKECFVMHRPNNTPHERPCIFELKKENGQLFIDE